MTEPVPHHTSLALPMRLLRAGVPLSLLLDLAAPDPDSAGICLTERPGFDGRRSGGIPRMA